MDTLISRQTTPGLEEESGYIQMITERRKQTRTPSQLLYHMLHIYHGILEGPRLDGTKLKTDYF